LERFDKKEESPPHKKKLSSTNVLVGKEINRRRRGCDRKGKSGAREKRPPVSTGGNSGNVIIPGGRNMLNQTKYEAQQYQRQDTSCRPSRPSAFHEYSRHKIAWGQNAGSLIGNELYCGYESRISALRERSSERLERQPNTKVN